MGRGRRNPGCGCCTTQTACLMFTTTFTQPDTSVHSEINDDLDVTAGTWEIQSNRLVATSTSARIVYAGIIQNRQQAINIEEMRGASGDVVNIYARWTDATDNVRFEITYGSPTLIKIYNNGSQLGDTIEALDILPNTDHPFHLLVYSNETISGMATQVAFENPFLAGGDWAGFYTTENGTTGSAVARSPYDSHTYYYKQDADIDNRAGKLFAVGTGSQANDVQISDITFREASYQVGDPLDAGSYYSSCGPVGTCRHVGRWNIGDFYTDIFGEPDIDDPNADVDAGWTNAGSPYFGVSAGAGKRFLYKTELPEATDCQFYITYVVESDTYGDGVEFIFDYVDDNNYKFWRSYAYNNELGIFTKVVQGHVYGEVISGVTRETEAILKGGTEVGDARTPTLRHIFNEEITPEKYSYLPFYTSSQGGKQVGFATLGSNTGTVTVDTFAVLHGVREDTSDPETAVCLTLRDAPAADFGCTDGKRERRYDVTVTGHSDPAKNGTFTLLVYDAVFGNHKYYSSNPRSGSTNASLQTVYDVLGDTTYLSIGTPGMLWKLDGVVNCLTLSSTALTRISGDSGASATITAVV